jgi:hypothetical protein
MRERVETERGRGGEIHSIIGSSGPKSKKAATLAMSSGSRCGETTLLWTVACCCCVVVVCLSSGSSLNRLENDTLLSSGKMCSSRKQT